MPNKRVLLEEARLNDARLDSLLGLTQMMDSPLQQITDYALQQAVAMTRSQIGYLAFANDDESVLTMHAWSKEAKAECAMAVQPLVYRVEDTGLWGETVRQRRPIVTNDYPAPNLLKRGFPEGHVPLSRHMNIPVFEGQRIVAVAGVGNKEIDYDDSDVRQLTLLMEAMWMLIQRHRYQQELHEHRDNLEQLVAERTEQLALEVERRRVAYEAVRAEQERLKELLALHERERRLIAYEIHDGLAQHIAGTLMEIQALESLVGHPSAEVHRVFEVSRERLARGLEEARNLISGLRPPSLDEFGVESAIQELILRRETGPTLTVDFHSELAHSRLEPVLEIAIFRIVQECITNARRHSGADRVSVSLQREDGWLCIDAQDGGVGFDPANVPGGRFGLEGIRERARLLGGVAEIRSAPARGTHIHVKLPFAAG
jgi:signal transduction histidine kinase